MDQEDQGHHRDAADRRRALTLIRARNRALVWRFGPQGLRKSTRWQAEHPLLMRLEGAASIGLGVLLAWWQYREPPRS